MKKTLLIFGALLCFGFLANAAESIKVTFEDAEIGSKGGVVSVYPPEGDFPIEVVANTYTTGNTSSKALQVPNAGYRGLFFENIAIPAGAESEYSAIKIKYLVVGGTDVNYPSLEIYSAPNNYTMGDTEKIGEVAWAGLWGEAELGVWKTVQFSLDDALIKPIPAGNLILKLVKGDCVYLIDDIELVPAPVTSSEITVADFEANTIGEELAMQKWNQEDGTATVKANPTVPAEKSVHIVTTNWDALLKLNVILPAGKTIADYDKIKFDIYLMSGEGIENNYKKMQIYVDRNKIYEDEGYPAQGAPETWLTKEYPLLEATSGNSFVLDLGISTTAGNYYIDNVRLIEKVASGLNDISGAKIYFNNNTLHLAKAGNVNIYDINGRLISSKVNVSSVDFGSFAHGVYIAKALIEGKKQVVKFVR